MKHFSYRLVRRSNDEFLKTSFPTWNVFKEFVVREAELSSLVKHPNIVDFYDYVIDDRTQEIFLIMEHVEGGSLGSFCKKTYFNRFLRWKRKPKRKRFRVVYKYNRGLERCANEEFSVDIIRQIVSAVGYLHSHNIAHMDLKPDNILIVPGQHTPSGAPVIKLCDFGIATIFSREKDGFLQGGAGTPFYFPPESLYAELHPGFSADIWTIGVMSVLFSTGSLPFAKNGLPFKYDGDVTLRTLNSEVNTKGLSESKSSINLSSFYE